MSLPVKEVEETWPLYLSVSPRENGGGVASVSVTSSGGGEVGVTNVTVNYNAGGEVGVASVSVCTHWSNIMSL